MAQNDRQDEKGSKHRTKKIILIAFLVLMPLFRYGIFDPYHHITLTIDLSTSTYYIIWSFGFFLLSVLWMDGLSDKAFKKRLKLKEELDHKESMIDSHVGELVALKEEFSRDNENKDTIKDYEMIEEVISRLNRELEETREIKNAVASKKYSLGLLLSEPIDFLGNRVIRRAILITLTFVYFIAIFEPNFVNAVDGISLVYLIAILSYFGSRTVEAFLEGGCG